MRLAAERFPWVESVAVARDWPRGLRVTVTEARPAAVGAFEDQAVLVSASGRVLGPKEGAPGLGWLWLAVAPPPAGAQLPEGSRAALTLIAAADPEVGARIRALRTDADGLLVGRLQGGPELRLGHRRSDGGKGEGARPGAREHRPGGRAGGLVHRPDGARATRARTRGLEPRPEVES